MIKDLLKEGFILKSNGYYKHAIEAFYKALEIDNSSLELMCEIADVYFLMGEEERALSYIEQVLDKNPAHIGSLNLLKKIFISKKAWQEAEQTARNICILSKSPKDYAELLEFLNKQKKYSEVINFTSNEITPDIIYQKAYAELFNNNANTALELINQALNAAPANPKYNLLKGKILFKLDRKSECTEICELLFEYKTDADILNFIGLIKQHQKDYKTALNCFLEAAGLNPDSAEYCYNCASTYFKSDDIKLAKKYYNLAISLEPENPNYHFALANLYYSLKQYKRALEELDTNLFEARLLKAIILYDTGYLAISKKELEKLEKEDSNNELIKDYLNRIKQELTIN